VHGPCMPSMRLDSISEVADEPEMNLIGRMGVSVRRTADFLTSFTAWATSLEQAREHLFLTYCLSLRQK